MQGNPDSINNSPTLRGRVELFIVGSGVYNSGSVLPLVNNAKNCNVYAYKSRGT